MRKSEMMSKECLYVRMKNMSSSILPVRLFAAVRHTSENSLIGEKTHFGSQFRGVTIQGFSFHCCSARGDTEHHEEEYMREQACSPQGIQETEDVSLKFTPNESFSS